MSDVFFYRLEDAESLADVFGRVSRFWDQFLSSNSDAMSVDTCLVVSHGLSIRLLMMRIFDWSIDTFETVMNMGNCNHITLRKNTTNKCYEFCPEESYPPHIPWSTREVFVKLKSISSSKEVETRLGRFKQLYNDMPDPNLADMIDKLEAEKLSECSKPYTVIDYLSIRQPRTRHIKDVVQRLVDGHGWTNKGREEMLAEATEVIVDITDVDFIDFWGERLSYRGKMLRDRLLRWL